MRHPRPEVKYEPICVLGAGAFGSVAQCRRLGPEGGSEIVAVKATRKEDGAWGLKHGLHEMKILNACNHPTIVKLLDAFQSRSGRAYLVMEYVEFCASSLLYTFPYGLPVAQLKLTAWQLCVALRYLHSRGILHRDVKPANILIARDGTTKLCDFGMARFQGSAGLHSGSDGALTSYVITRWYRPPEVLLGLSYGPSADVFSLGCTVAELATGATLFPGSSSVDQIHRLVHCLGPMPPHMVAAAAIAAATGAQPAANGSAAAAGLQGPQGSPFFSRGRGLADRLASLGGVQPEPQLMQFIEACLELDPARRMTPNELLQLPYFDDVGLLVSGSPLEGLYVRECHSDEEDSADGPGTALNAPAAAATTQVQTETQAGAGALAPVPAQVLSIAAMLESDGPPATTAGLAPPVPPRVPCTGSSAASACRVVSSLVAGGREGSAGAAAGASGVTAVSLVDVQGGGGGQPAGANVAVAVTAPQGAPAATAAVAGLAVLGGQWGLAAGGTWLAVRDATSNMDTPGPRTPDQAVAVQVEDPAVQPCVVLDVARLLKVATAELAGHAAHVARLCATVEAATAGSSGGAAVMTPSTCALGLETEPGAAARPRSSLAQCRSEAAAAHLRPGRHGDNLTASPRQLRRLVASAGAICPGAGSGVVGPLDGRSASKIACDVASGCISCCGGSSLLTDGTTDKGPEAEEAAVPAGMVTVVTGHATSLGHQSLSSQGGRGLATSGGHGYNSADAQPAAPATATAPGGAAAPVLAAGSADAPHMLGEGGGESWHGNDKQLAQQHQENERCVIGIRDYPARPEHYGAENDRTVGVSLHVAAPQTSGWGRVAPANGAGGDGASLRAAVPARASGGMDSVSFSERPAGRLLLSTNVAGHAAAGGAGGAGGGSQMTNLDMSMRSSTIECSLARTATGIGCGGGGTLGGKYGTLSSASGLGGASARALDAVWAPGFSCSNVAERPRESSCCGTGNAMVGSTRKVHAAKRRGGLSALLLCWRPQKMESDS